MIYYFQMNDKTLLAKTQISPYIKHKAATSGNRLRFTSPNKQSYSSQKFKTLNIESSDSLPNLSKQPRIDNKKMRFLSTQNKSNYTLLKSSEELHEQNITLKLKMKTIQANLGRQKVRKEINIKNMKKLHQKINVEYSEQIFIDILPHHKYLVEGVKYQYYKLKQLFQQKCNQLNQALKQSNNIQNAELKIYCEALENENRLLKDRVAKMLKIQEQMFKQMQFLQYIKLSKDGGIQATNQWIKQQEINMIQLLGVSSKIAQLEKKSNDATINNEKLKEKSQIQKQMLKQRKYKFIILQNIIKSKENKMHSIKKRLQNEIKEKNQIIKRLNLSIQQQQRRHKQALQALISKNKKKMQTQKDIYQRYLRQSEKQCETYRRQLKRLSLIVNSLNNNLQDNNMPFSKKQNNKMYMHRQQQHQNQQKEKVFDKFSLTFQKDSYLQDGKNRQIEKQQLQGQQSKRNIEVKQIKSSYIKHSIDCIKVKPVKIQQIQHQKQQLKYRFIFHQLQIDAVKEYLTISQLQIQKLQKKEQQWITRYIQLKQIKQKLMKSPFCLSAQMALRFSRYIVEDCTKDVVYYHEDNEIERVMAKSVLRSFVGQYVLPNEKEAKSQISRVLNKKGSNLHSALLSLAPSGLISFSKLKQICQMIEVLFSQSAWDYLLGQLSLKSSIYQLNYKEIFKHM